MNKSKELEKYRINEQDWENINLVQMKMKAESVVSLFLVLENIELLKQLQEAKAVAK